MTKCDIRFKKYIRDIQHKWCIENLEEEEVVNELQVTSETLIDGKEGREGIKESILTVAQEIEGKRKRET